MSKEARETQIEGLIREVTQLIKTAAITPPADVRARLAAFRQEETGAMASAFYDAMLEDLTRAEEKQRPCCQDTGILQFFVQAGSEFPLLGELEAILQEAAARATQETPLRPNVVQVFEDRNTGTNTGEHIPWIEWEILPGSREAAITLYLAGGGCSLPGIAKVFPPLEGEEGLRRLVYEQVSTLGVNACPPLLVGIGLAGSIDIAAKLSKKALYRPLGSHNPHPDGARLEQELEDGLNAIGIGPGGVTGARSVLGVHIEAAGRHPAAYAVGLSVSCWIHRRYVLQIGEDLSCAVFPK